MRGLPTLHSEDVDIACDQPFTRIDTTSPELESISSRLGIDTNDDITYRKKPRMLVSFKKTLQSWT